VFFFLSNQHLLCSSFAARDLSLYQLVRWLHW
jgi:hypothetical protein